MAMIARLKPATLPALLSILFAGCAAPSTLVIARRGPQPLPTVGSGFTSPMTNVLEVFDPALGTWSTKAPMPTTRGGINGIAADGNFFVWGGEGPDGVFEQMEMYVPEQNRWYELEPLPIAVHGVTGSAFLKGWIHIPGGGTSNGGSSGSAFHQVFWVEGINP